jgi:hypothetical protein
MTSVRSISTTIRRILTTEAAEAARATHCIQRRGKFTGQSLCQTLILGWLGQPAASLTGLCQTAAGCGVRVTPQGLDQRFTPALAACLQQLLGTAAQAMITADPRAIPLFARFGEIAIRDTTSITLPACLAETWPGCGNGSPTGGAAVLKVGAGLQLRSGQLLGPVLAPGRTHDRTVAAAMPALAPGTLLIQDLGYFSLATFATLAAAQIQLLSRLQAGTRVFTPDGTPLDLVAVLGTTTTSLDCPVLVGARERLPLRLLTSPVPPEVADQRRRRIHAEAQRRGQTPTKDRLALAAWTILVTTVPPAQLSLPEALVLLRARWQIELLFKLWKERGALDTWRTANPQRMLCELAAKLIGLIIQHWILLAGPWSDPALSLCKAAGAVRATVPLLIHALMGRATLSTTIRHIADLATAGAGINPRRAKPNASQLWADPSLGFA